MTIHLRSGWKLIKITGLASIGNGTTNIGNGVWHSEDACEVKVQRASYSVLVQIMVQKIPCKVKKLNRN